VEHHFSNDCLSTSITRISPSHTVMYQISFSPDYTKLDADYFNADITLTERWFPHVKADCFIDLRAPDHSLDWITSKYTGRCKPYNIQFRTSFSNFLEFRLSYGKQLCTHLQLALQIYITRTINAKTGLDVRERASKRINSFYANYFEIVVNYITQT